MALPLDNDLATQLASEGGGPGNGLTWDYQTPGTASPNMLTPDAESSAPVMTVGGGSTAPAVVPVATATPVVVSDNFWNKLKGTVGSAQSAIVKPVQEAASKAAASAGLDADKAQTVGSLAPWLLAALLGGILATVYALRRRIFSHQITA